MSRQLNDNAFSNMHVIADMRYVLFLTCLTLSGLLSGLRAEIDLGSKGALAFGLDALLEYDSNITRSAEELDDVLGIATPTAYYRHDRGLWYVDAFAGMQIRRYSKYSEFDSENFKSGLDVVYPNVEGEKNFELKFHGGFNQSTKADADIGDIVKKEFTVFRLNGKYFFTDRYYAKVGVSYEDQDTEDQDGISYVDIIWTTLPVEFFYRYNDALSFGFGYQYRDTESNSAADSIEHAFYAAVEGQVAPSLSADVRLGWQQRDFYVDGFEDQDALFALVALKWRASGSTSVELTAGNEFQTSTLSNVIEASYVELSASQNFDDKISARLALRYNEREYSLLTGENFRTDEEWVASLSSEYVLIEDQLTLNALFRYSDKNSNVPTSEYGRTVFLVGASFTY